MWTNIQTGGLTLQERCEGRLRFQRLETDVLAAQPDETPTDLAPFATLQSVQTLQDVHTSKWKNRASETLTSGVVFVDALLKRSENLTRECDQHKIHSLLFRACLSDDSELRKNLHVKAQLVLSRSQFHESVVVLELAVWKHACGKQPPPNLRDYEMPDWEYKGWKAVKQECRQDPSITVIVPLVVDFLRSRWVFAEPIVS